MHTVHEQADLGEEDAVGDEGTDRSLECQAIHSCWGGRKDYRPIC